MGHDGTNWELGFKQYSFHHAFQVLRVCNFSAFSLPPAFPPCCCPLAFQRQVRRLTYKMSSESYPGYPECVVSCHGAGRLTNSIRPFFRRSPSSCCRKSERDTSGRWRAAHASRGHRPYPSLISRYPTSAKIPMIMNKRPAMSAPIL